MVQHSFVMVGCTKLSYSIIFVELGHKSLQLSYVMHRGIDLHDQLCVQLQLYSNFYPEMCWYVLSQFSPCIKSRCPLKITEPPSLR